MDALLTTTKGKRLFLHEGYQYRYVSTTKREARNIYRCVDKGCKSRLHADAQGHVISIRNQHNHSENYSAAELRLHRRALLEAAIHGDDSRENILRSRQRLSTATNAPSYEADRRFITRKRAAPVAVAKLLNASITSEPANPATVTVLLKESSLDLSQVLQSGQPSTSVEHNADTMAENVERVPLKQEESGKIDKGKNDQQSYSTGQKVADAVSVQSSSNAARCPVVVSAPSVECSNVFRLPVKDSEAAQPSVSECFCPEMVDAKLHIRHVLLWEWQCGTSAAAAARKICDVLGEGSMSQRTALWWYQRFKSGKFSLEDDERAGRPSAFDDNRLNALIRDNPQMTTRELAKQLNCCRSTVQNHLRAIERKPESRRKVKKRPKCHELTPSGKPMEVVETNSAKQPLPAVCDKGLKAADVDKNVLATDEGNAIAEDTTGKRLLTPCKDGVADLNDVLRHERQWNFHHMGDDLLKTAEGLSELTQCQQERLSLNQLPMVKEAIHVCIEGSSDEVETSLNGIAKTD
ncbi:Histone-lysine N-methyltransferase SETMAR [Toxocara canis]|uniref:Histone-lysine N-methyltransferase SETMAR n=1 Tax=Toxocara canis TaxID=6265 RepID=A0A0B2VC53_TOXCA|nr:Histone-lysine N-methyltransferase SETMAR [Toxocara canis]